MNVVTSKKTTKMQLHYAPAGSLFEISGDFFMKTDGVEDGCCLCVKLSTGVLTRLDNYDVMPVQEVTISGGNE